MASNPNPTRISSALWELWTKFDKLEKSVQYGGTYTVKPGYHNARQKLSRSDYSVGDVGNDRLGSAQLTSAIDLTMSRKAMVKYSKRLDAAMRARDKRLFINGEPILREYIGTKDNKTVHCYVLVGGRKLGVGADSGEDPGRDKKHLWHIHISFIRKYVSWPAATERVYSILAGETYTAWAKRHGVAATPTHAVTPPPPTASGLPFVKNGSRVLKEGMRGTDVRFVQKWIGPKRAGPANGIADAKFTAGVKWYQAMRGLKDDGIVGSDTWAAMGVH
jgi:hypothetical protein